MDLGKYSLDLYLVPASLLLNAGYHGYIWQCSKSKRPVTAISLNLMKRKAWLADILPGNDKRVILGVQSLRNYLMSAVLTASIAIMLNSGLAAMANNTLYKFSQVVQNPSFGLQAGSQLVVLKYASASLLLLLSFLCSSIAVGCVIEASFLMGVSEEMLHVQAERMLTRGWMLALVGKRVLYIAVSLLMWLFGPVPFALSTVALVWMFYSLDFVPASC